MSKPDLIAIGRYYEWDIASMRAEFTLHELKSPDAVASLPEEVRAATRAVAFKGHHPFGDAHMQALPRLEAIANYGVGYDAIDVAAATARRIRVTNTPDVLTDDVADLAIAMWLVQSRQLLKASQWVRSGRWAGKGEPDLAHKASGGKVGIVGLGRIGQAIAGRLGAFGTEIHYHSRDRKKTPSDWIYHADPVNLAKVVDTLFVALVDGPQTQNYVSKEVIAALGSDGTIVNISRGSTVDEAALLDALENGRIRGAALDVFLNEPNIDPRFLALDNVLLLPHIGSASVETRKAMGQLQRDNLGAHFAGRPLLTPVN